MRKLFFILFLVLVGTMINEEKILAEEIVISAVGDCTLGRDSKFDYLYTFDYVFEKQKKNYDYFLSKVKDELKKDNLTVANLEGPLTNNGKRADKEYAFKGSPSYTKILKSGSIEVVNLVNNHTYDYGWSGYEDTKSCLRREGIGYFDYENKYITKIKGIPVGFVGYNEQRYNCLGPELKVFKRQVTNDLKELKDKCDLIIVSFHWGKEGAYYPTAIQRDLAHLAVDNGANLVLGHHPHVIQGIESYKGVNIVYSLGNFSFGGNRNPPDKDTIIFRQVFSFDSGGRLIRDSKIRVIPCSISSSSKINNYQPIILKGKDQKRVLARIEKYSWPLNYNN